MLPFIFTNVTQILRCRPDAHKGRIYNVSFLFFFFQRWRFIRSQSDTQVKNLHPGSASSPPPLLPSLSPFTPPLSPLAALHRSMVLLLNELRHLWRYHTLTICSNPLHMLQSFIDPASRVHSQLYSCSRVPKVNKTTSQLQN